MELMGLLGAFVARGVPPSSMSQGFVPVPGSDQLSIPVLSVRGFLPGNEEQQLVYRLDDHTMTCTPADCEQRWLAWSIERLTRTGRSDKHQLAVLAETYQKSSFCKPKVLMQFMALLRHAGIRFPEPTTPPDEEITK